MMSLTDHADPIMDLLYGTPNLTVYPAENGGPTVVPNGTPPPYVSVHIIAVRDLGPFLPMRSDRMRLRIYCQCVGANDIAARGVSDLVAGALLDVRPSVFGRVSFPIRQESGQDPRADESTGTTVVTISDVYRLETLPGAVGS